MSTKAKPRPVTVRAGSVALKVSPYVHASGLEYWRAAYYDQGGRRRFLSRATLDEARQAAQDKAQELSRGAVDFAALAPHQLRAIRRMLDADPQLSSVDKFLLWHSREFPEVPTDLAVSEFLAAKEAGAGLSAHNVKTLRSGLRSLECFGKRSLATITAPELEELLAKRGSTNRTRANVRNVWVTFFAWCLDRRYLPEGQTEAQKVGEPLYSAGVPSTFTHGELALMLTDVRPEFLPWLALSAFAGIRADEICPAAASRKPPLDWADIRWDDGIIIVRAETAKTKRRRIIPIFPALRSWLYPVRQEAGPVHVTVAPSFTRGKGQPESETTRLGKLAGGWRKNALRHSFISYRAALVGLGKTAKEAGNSEGECKKSYDDAKSEAEGAAWFAVMRVD
jgi:integrase